MTTVQETTEQAEERPRLLAVEMGDWPGLGGNVRLDLTGWRTVLVGKNGAGKSLLIEGLSQAAIQSWYSSRFADSSPRYFRCDIMLSGNESIAYEYRIHTDEVEEAIDASVVGRSRHLPAWTERCWRLANGEDLWRVTKAQLFIGSAPGIVFPPGMGLLGADNLSVKTPDEVQAVYDVLYGFRLIRAGTLRGIAGREEVLVSSIHDGRGGRRWQKPAPHHMAVESLARAMTLMYESQRDTFDEFSSILRQLGLVDELTVKIYEDPQTDQNESKRRDYASVLFDGVNIGLLSDGTQRITQIIRLLLQEKFTCLLIEEPETAVHPGLLSKLLALFDSYGYDRQIVISTHSPQVVDWCKPDDLRLVERSGGKTVVRSLSAEDLNSVKRYLHEEGTFSEFVYGRADL